MQTLTEAVAKWTQGVSELMQVASDEVKGSPNTTTEKATELHAQCEPLIQLVTRQLESSGKSIQTSEWELLGRSITKLNRELNDWISESTWVREQNNEAWKDDRQRATRDLANQAKRMVQDASRINRYAQAIFGKTVSIGILDDTMALEKSITPLTNTTAPTSSNRLPRHVKIALGRLVAIEGLIQQHMKPCQILLKLIWTTGPTGSIHGHRGFKHRSMNRPAKKLPELC